MSDNRQYETLLAAAAGFGWQEREEDVLRVAKREAVSAYIRRRSRGQRSPRPRCAASTRWRAGAISTTPP